MFKERLIGLSYAQKRILQIIVDIILIWSALWLSLFLRLGGEDDWLFPSTEQLWLFVLAPLLALPIYIKTGMYRSIFSRL